MDSEEPITDLVEIPHLLNEAERVANRGVRKNDERYFKSAYSILEGCCNRLNSAEEVLDNQYRNSVGDLDEDPIEHYTVDLDRLDEDSHPATVALAFPRYFELVKETQEELDSLAERQELGFDNY